LIAYSVVTSLAFGNEYGVAVVDIVQKVCLLNIGTPDLYGMPHPFIIRMFFSVSFGSNFIFGFYPREFLVLNFLPVFIGQPC